MRQISFGFREMALLCLALTVLLCSPAHAFLYDTFSAGPGFPNRVDDHIDDMNDVDPADYVDIIVDFCSTPTAADSTFLDQYGDIYGVFRFIGAIAVRNVLVSDCYEIVNYPRLKLIEWDQALTPHLDVSCAAIQARASGTYPYPAQAAWDLNPPVGYLGNGVTVAIIDSGVDDAHPALAGKFVAGYDGFTQTGGFGVNPDDDMLGWFHGTGVAGMIMANDPSQMYMGVAPHASLVDCKIFDNNGSSPASRSIATIRWVMQNASLYNITVANMSFGGRPDDGTDAVARAADALVASGVTVVASAGNFPPSVGISSPGSGHDVICVGGVTDNATISRPDDLYDSVARVGPRQSPPPSYALSQNDLKPEVSAYMRDITSCLGIDPGQSATGWWQHPGTGTSWSAAHVSGVAALVLEKYPGLPPAQVDNMIRVNAEPRGGPSYPSFDPVWNYMYGYGIVSAANVMNAVLLADVSVKGWVPGTWNSQSIWAGHYPVKVGDPNTLNARVSANGAYAPGVVVLFEVMRTGWGSPYSPIASTTVNVPQGGSVVASIPFTPAPGQEGHKCFRVTATYSADPNQANNSAQENIDIEPAMKSSWIAHQLASLDASEETSAAAVGGTNAGPRAPQRYAFAITMCVEPMAPVPFRTADACICTKDLPVEATAWLEPEPPFDLMPGECQPCSLIVQIPEGVYFEPGDAVYVNGWFWGNGVAEGGASVYFVTSPPIEATIAEIQYTDDIGAGSPLQDQIVTTSGIATTENTTYGGMFAMQDGEGAWNGVFAINIGLPVTRGDELELTGMVLEINGMTVIDPVGAFDILSAGNPVPEPEIVEPVMVDGWEDYEGVLVKVENATVVGDTPYDWDIEANGTICGVGSWASYAYTPVLLDELDVTGVAIGFGRSRNLQPRDDDDIVPATIVPPEGMPTALSLAQNAPNPFGPLTGIAYALPVETHVTLEVYSVAGRRVCTLVDAVQPAGHWNVEWNGLDETGNHVAKGVYFYRLDAGGETIEKRMVLIE